MWHTPDGEKRLVRALAHLLLASMIDLVDRLRRTNRSVKVGARAFDRLSPDRQAFAAIAVAERLTDDHEAPQPQAWAESAVYALFVHAERRVKAEIARGPGGPTRWRSLARAAFAADWTGDPEEVPATTSRNRDGWEFALCVLTDGVFSDRDFLDEDIYDGCKNLPAYFVGGPPEWTPRERERLQRY